MLFELEIIKMPAIFKAGIFIFIYSFKFKTSPKTHSFQPKAYLFLLFALF
jgi:hypothetical protein